MLADLEQYIIAHAAPESPLLQQIREASALLPGGHMVSGIMVTRLLQLLILISQAKTIVEIGTFTAYASCAMAEVLSDDGTITTFEADERVLPLAQNNINNSKFKYKIRLIHGNALFELDKFNPSIDLAFIDADKANYVNYYQKLLPKMSSHGILVFDNALWQGEVLSPISKKALIIDELNKKIALDAKNNKVDNLILNIRDGVHIVRKKN